MVKMGARIISERRVISVAYTSEARILHTIYAVTHNLSFETLKERGEPTCPSQDWHLRLSAVKSPVVWNEQTKTPMRSTRSPRAWHGLWTSRSGEDSASSVSEVFMARSSNFHRNRVAGSRSGETR